MGRNKPRIAVAIENRKVKASEPAYTAIRVNAGQMQPGEDKIVSRSTTEIFFEKVVSERIYAVLSKKRNAKPTSMQEPSSSVAGRWDLTIEYYSSKTHYTWVLQQNGNSVEGIHSGAFATQNIFGTIEGTKIKMKTTEGEVADRINFIFTGEVTGDAITGSVYMVEYGTVRFTASRYLYKNEHMPIFVPGGPPLST